MSGGTYSLTSTLNDRFFEKLFHGRFIYSQSFCQKSAEREEVAEEIFFIFHFWWLTWYTNPGFASNKLKLTLFISEKLTGDADLPYSYHRSFVCINQEWKKCNKMNELSMWYLLHGKFIKRNIEIHIRKIVPLIVICYEYIV